ncbi:hypothetical protein [Schleiferilactobacillus shenzhenensis]|uniref:WxL domain-containing protein n=1 Tax=Schleiferilactobacillus shenzhenensis LY-73 TaxID=1231336 RepID=U4TTG9_9LACO|nr:hypothetical protein [Schleiferilactobacillus shenzhenensis]ERL64747.1 hypothetical protein L248_0666 [Schleiferilactobacillus shenzhenensis LY-73]
MKKGLWGILFNAGVVLLSLGLLSQHQGTVLADSSSATGTATVGFTGGTSLLQVPNFDFGVRTIGGGELFPLYNTVTANNLDTTATGSALGRTVIVEVPTGAAAAGTDGWQVKVNYVNTPVKDTNSLFNDAALIFASNSIGEYTSGIPGMGTWYSGRVTDLGKGNDLPDNNWVVHRYSGDLSRDAIQTLLASGTRTDGVLPVKSATPYTLFGRKTNVPDVSLVNTIDPDGSLIKGKSTVKYQFNFNLNTSAYLYVPLADQTGDVIDKIYTGSLEWTLSTGIPGDW